MGIFLSPPGAEWPGHCHFCLAMSNHSEGEYGNDLKIVCDSCGSWCIDSMSLKYNGIPRWIKWK